MWVAPELLISRHKLTTAVRGTYNETASDVRTPHAY